jgi:hypothetical protein
MPLIKDHRSALSQCGKMTGGLLKSNIGNRKRYLGVAAFRIVLYPSACSELMHHTGAFLGLSGFRRFRKLVAGKMRMILFVVVPVEIGIQCFQ